MRMFASASELDDALRRSGYIADSVAVTTVYLAAALHRPVLLEGPAGSGKTQLAYAVAEAAQTGWSACNAMRALTKRRRSESLTNRCNGSLSNTRNNLSQLIGTIWHWCCRAESS